MSNDPKPAESTPPEQSSSQPGPSNNSVGSQVNGQVSTTQKQASTSASASLLPAQTPTEAPNREQLLDRARSFLVSPQVQNQDLPAKRAFLREKGLSEAEIEKLLHTLPLNPPSIPPRTYPQPPPSNLPVLLLGIVRLFTWLAGGSAALLLLYRVFLLPRITQTWLAKNSLKSHQLALLRQLTTSLSSLKEAQSESFSILPHSDPFKESKQFSRCKSVADILKVTSNGDEEQDFAKLPMISLLRCAIKDTKNKPTTEELFRFLEEQIPWLLTEEGLNFEQQLWETLTTCPLFEKSTASSPSVTPSEAPSLLNQWEYLPPAPVASPPLSKALDELASELPQDGKSRKSLFQHTLKTMSDFTGYLSTQVYMPYRASAIGTGVFQANGQTSLEEELRKEIRALKGLVLNRRSFMQVVPRPGVTSPVRTTT
ncbi:hypothetical protein HYPSUDRAFT_126070 [Hypholoma sublateritium FD-334 SS-4]|uniref:Peroxisome membrane anchor protein Pex14p N-terminal domain-containing protein n=1 Tax=Hypholoma sublateritium (strain FD-334 SS-4) TaxID=945553 RepID=A0A0D2PNZ0_HYPSF|nr:hypothetical protein HYPSUDRAFT_126070 [Hypholoma sublateritium FD-334 SS-4]